MKKIFNYALLAAALLVGVNVNAQNVSSYAQLKSAVEAGTDANITLMANIEFPVNEANFPVYGLVIGNGQKVTIDLNGYTITRDNKINAKPTEKKDGFMFSIVKGTLHLTGEGSLIGKGDVHTGFASVMGGDFLKYADGYIYCSDSTKVTALTTDNMMNYSQTAIGIKTWQKLDKSTGKGGVYECQGMASIIFMVGTSELKANVSNLIVDENVNLLNEDGKAAVQIYINTGIYSNIPGIQTTIKDSKHYANGVNIDIAGYIKSYQYGIQVSGNVKKDEADTEAQYVPYIFIRPSAQIVVASDWYECTGIYCAGYAKWNIQGTVQGSTGAYIKSGDVTFDDATIESTNTNTTTTQGKGSGIAAGGTGVVVEGNASYAGGMDVTIAGDTKITGASGYGIEQVITSGDANDLEQLNIIGGTIVGGEQGGIIVENANKEEVVIAGGSSSETTIAVKGEDGTTKEIGIDQFFPEDGEKYHTTTIDNGDGTTTTVVTKGEEPAKQENPFNINELTEGANIDFNGQTTIQTLTKDVVLGEVVMVSPEGAAEQIIVADHTTLRVKKLVMGPKANITVNAGGTLIVDGEQGIVANAESNLVIEAQEGQMGQFLFNPAVTSNRHPQATVELISRGYKISSGNYIWQRFGTPLKNAIQVQEMVSQETPAVGNAVYGWDYGVNDWKQLAKTDVLTPFTGYTETTNASEGGHKFAMGGELVGNVAGNLSFLADWNYFANSYTANVDLKQLLKPLQESPSIHATVWIYKPTVKENLWDVVSLSDVLLGEAEVTTLNPMQAFIIKSSANDKHAVDYAKCVWNPVMNPGANSAPRAMTQSLNSVTITLANENGYVDKVKVRESADFSAEYENGYDVEKMMQGNTNMYIVSEMGNLCQIATDNVEGQTILLATKNADNFTLSFSNVRGEKMAIRDNMTGDVIEMAEGVTYNFIANANEVSERFTIIAAAQAPTALKKAEASAKAAKFIRNDQVVLQNNGRLFNVLGAEVK